MGDGRDDGPLLRVLGIAQRAHRLQLDDDDATKRMQLVEAPGGGQDVLEARNMRQPRLELREREVVQAREIGKKVVVEGRQPAVTRQLHIDLDHAGSRLESLLDRGQGVLDRSWGTGVARLKIFLAGACRVESDARPRIAVTRKKGQALLALLALRPGTGYPRDALMALLWPDSSDEEARHSLRQELHELRRALAPTRTRALIVDGERIALDPDAIEVDVVKFERLSADGTPAAMKRAAGPYDGDLMLGIGVRESAFEEHLRSERERLRARAVGVITRLLEHQVQRGPVDVAIETALRLLAMDPTQETVHRALMKLYARSDRRATALRQYQECVEVLQRELGVEPEPATRQLYREILASNQTPRTSSAFTEPSASDGGRRGAPPKSDRFG